jgi:tripartite-type tricarboxylate transporter receptor subunit TctC
MMPLRILRGCVVIASIIAAVTLWSGTAPQAQVYPDRPIKMIVPFPAGGGADVLVRILTNVMAADLGQSIIIINHPGAGGALAYAEAAHAAPDGYTLVWTAAGIAIVAATLPNLGFNPKRDLVHVCAIAQNPLVLVVNPQVEARSVAELIAAAKAKPDTINFANNGNGTLTNLAVELLKLQTGAPVVQVAYRGDNFSISDVLAGHVQAMFSNSPVALPHLTAGRLRGLAVTSPQRSPAIPELPTMIEAGVADFSAVVWQGFSVPAGVSPAIIARLNSAARQALNAPEVAARFKELGAEPMGGTPEAFDALVRHELDIWADVVRRSGVTAN